MAEAGSRRSADYDTALENVRTIAKEMRIDPRLATDAATTSARLRQELYDKGLKGFKKGGKVKKTGVYKLHKGEKVVPANKAKSQNARDIAMLKRTKFR